MLEEICAFIEQGLDLKLRGVFLDNKLYLEKSNQIKEILNELDIDLWLILGRETSDVCDPALRLILPINVMGISAFFFVKTGERIALVRNADVIGVELTKIFTKVIGYADDFDIKLKEIILNLNPNVIDINCDLYDPLTDGLTVGLYFRLMNALSGTNYEQKIQMGKAIRAIRGRKTNMELSIIKSNLSEIHEICKSIDNFLKVGITDGYVYKYCQDEMKKRGATSSWDNHCCPLVHAGKRANQGMVTPTDNAIRKGDVFHVSFGIKKNGYATDFQRTWYALDDGEETAPDEVLNAFNILKDTIDETRKRCKPGVKGSDIDKLSRDSMAKHGVSYSRGSGHTVGRALHDGAVSLSQKSNTFGDLTDRPIEIGFVFTLELFMETSRGVVALEEMVVVEEDCAKFICSPQTEIWYIK